MDSPYNGGPYNTEDLRAFLLGHLPEADAAPIEILSHPLKLPKLVIRQFWHERFDAEPALMWLRKTLRVAVANASQLRLPPKN